jgi:acylphosphatase
MSDERIQLRVAWHGRVQGVGFRYTTNRIARRFPVSGSVRNLADGTVELIVAGKTGQVRAFLAAIADAFHGNITLADEQPLDVATDVPDGFSIRR